MAISLDDFIKEAHARVEWFEKFWKENHAADPENFPLELPEENAGLWWEQFNTFEDY